MACNIIIDDLRNFEITWDAMSMPIQHGLANEADAVSVEFTGDDVDIRSSATGLYSYIAANADTKGEITFQFMTGTPQLAELRAMAYGQRFIARGDLTISNLLTGENFVFDCAGLKSRPGWSTGVNNDGVTEVVFNFTAVSGYTPAQALQSV